MTDTRWMHRAITIHDGTRVTPTIARIITEIAESSETLARESSSYSQNDRTKRGAVPEHTAERFDAIIVSRANGTAIYVGDRRLM